MDAGSPTHIDYEIAIFREQQALQQALAHLNDVEQQVLSRQAQLHQQINWYSGQAYQAQQGGQQNQVARALEQRAAVMAAHASLQEQLERIAARKAEIGARQQHLQDQFTILRSGQPQPDLHPYGGPFQSSSQYIPPVLPSTFQPNSSLYDGLGQPPAQYAPPAPPSKRHMPLLWLTWLLAIVLVVGSVAFTLHQRQLRAAQTQPGSSQISPGASPTQSGTLRLGSNAPFYHAAANAPSLQDCLDNFRQACYSAENLQQAFRLNPLYHSGYNGSGQTIVLLGAGHTTTLRSDLHHFDQAWGLPDPDLTIVQPHGPPTPYTCPGGGDPLEGENTLDVEWAHAIAPGAKIVLVIGQNGGGTTPQENCTGNSTLPEDIDYAITHHLGQVISVSYGGSELGWITDTASDRSAEQQFYQDSHAIFERAANQGITVLASAGDDGATNPDDPRKANAYWDRPNVSWPASDPYVLAVGGTKLSLDANSDYQSETVWNETGFGATGGGISTVFLEPDYQKSVPNQALFQGERGMPDVAFPADNIMVYDSSNPGVLGQINQAWRHWAVVGGTSVSAPAWAGLVAIANQVRGKPIGLLQPALYSLQGKGMHDITSGNNSFHHVTGYQAQKGYDLATGWGTPIGDQFIPALVQATRQM
jgi:hypothetical protein